MIHCGVYRDGVPLPPMADVRKAAAALDGKRDFVWIGLFEPSRGELQEVAETFRFHPLAVEDAYRAHQRPKLEPYGDQLFIVLKTVWYVGAERAVETGEINLFVGPRFVVTVRHGAGVQLADTRHDLEERTATLGHGPSAVVHAVCDRVVDEYEAVAAALEEEVEEIERSVFSPERPSTGQVERMYALKREMLEFRRAVAPLREPMDRLARGAVRVAGDQARPFFRDVYDHVIRVSEQADALDALLSSMLDAQMTRIGVQQNADMRRISAWVAIVAVPTMIAGIYGMNFEHMPELTWTFGYPLALLVMLTCCALLYRAFKRSGWL